MAEVDIFILVAINAREQKINIRVFE